VPLLLALAAGCAPIVAQPRPLGGAEPAAYENPAFIAYKNHEALWEIVTDAVDDYFDIESQQPVRVVGDVITEGRIDTRPSVSSTLLEPWRRDTANLYEKVESTLQSMRRFASIRVRPADNGFWVEVAVYKELENLGQPEYSTAGGATLRNDTSLTRVVNPVGAQEVHQGWIAMGRDPALEQQMICQIQSRLSGETPMFRGPEWNGKREGTVRR
jgi:hypothetical protein